jgi:predicted DNA-binding transcriptional regulator AlpA
MPETNSKAPHEMAVTLTVGELRDLIRAEVKAALHGSGAADPDKLLSIGEASEVLSRSSMWLYRNWKRLPFSVRLGRSVRFSRKGIEKWIEAQKRG